MSEYRRISRRRTFECVRAVAFVAFVASSLLAVITLTHLIDLSGLAFSAGVVLVVSLALTAAIQKERKKEPEALVATVLSMLAFFLVGAFLMRNL